MEGDIARVVDVRRAAEDDRGVVLVDPALAEVGRDEVVFRRDLDQTLTVADEAYGDQGWFNEWCLHFIYDDGSLAAINAPKLVLALHENFPNPFNPITHIKFDLPKAGHVRLDVFDVSGRLVRTLVDEDRAAASHRVTWDGTDNRGARAASGAYYYRLQTGNSVITNKMMLVK